MRPEFRFILAIVLMVGVLVGTNILFPPVQAPEDDPVATAPRAPTGIPEGEPEAIDPERSSPEGETGTAELPGVLPVEARTVAVESPLYRIEFSSRGARIESAELLNYPSFTREGAVDLIFPGSNGSFGNRVVFGADTLDLDQAVFTVEPAEGIVLNEGDSPRDLHFRWVDARGRGLEIRYRFSADSYLTDVSGRVLGSGASLLLTSLGEGIAFNEEREKEEVRTRAYVTNHARDGIKSRELTKVREAERLAGPLRWAGFRNRYFVLAILGDETGDGSPGDLGGAEARPLGGEGRVGLTVGEPLGPGGTFSHRIYLGPQDYAILASVGDGFQEINAYGWSLLRPLLRPFVAIVTTVLVWLHENLNLSYGWVLVLFGVMMRLLLWPLNQKAMRAQFRNMAVQPLLQDAQKKYKNDPEKLQKEMMKLYKEHGFNPLAGCLPLLLPWPILIALFFVFQNTIEFRGVPFLWLPDLSGPDPFYILPIFLGLSMFAMQWVSIRSLPEVNSQMKFMLWFMPLFMVILFLNFAAGLNLYYAVSNIATIPQQWWIARERKKVQVHRPPPSKG